MSAVERPEDMPGALLDWYDRHARRLPWRVPPDRRRAGEAPDPYRVWLSEIMLQQTTVAAVAPYFERFTMLWPRVEDLAAAEDAQVMAEWAGLGYYARARNLLKCARVVAGQGGFPRSEAGLRALPGIGPYTAAAVAAIAYDLPETVLDGNVERVMARIHAVTDPLPGSKETLRAHAAALTPALRPGDYAQAVMDLGATICTPRSPACGICPWCTPCRARRAGIAAELPRKTPKKAKPVRRGHVYVALDPSGRILAETRPDSGLLGGMLGLPGSDWSEVQPDPAPPCAADWHAAGEVRHTFTHFHLILEVHAARCAPGAVPPGRDARAACFRDVADSAFPTVMRKALRAGRMALDGVSLP